MLAAEPGQFGGTKRLHAQTEAGDPGFGQLAGLGVPEAVRIGLHAPLLRLAPRGHREEFLHQGGGEGGGSAAAEKDPAGSEVEFRGGCRPFGP